MKKKPQDPNGRVISTQNWKLQEISFESPGADLMTMIDGPLLLGRFFTAIAAFPCSCETNGSIERMNAPSNGSR
jgi:hypothetical protein